jgi:flavin-dependent dehydrogenase
LKPDIYFEHRHQLLLYFDVVECGFAWFYHHGDCYSAGLGGLMSKISSPQEKFRRFCFRMGMNPGKRNAKGWFVPRGGVKRNVCKNRMILTGDAAGFVDSFSGEGIAYAIRSGQIAAEVLGNAIKKNRYGENDLKEYEKLCDKEFGGKLFYSLMLSKILYRFPKTAMRLFCSKKELLHQYLFVPIDKISYKRFIMWFVPQLPWLYLGVKLNDLRKRLWDGGTMINRKA